MKVFFWSTWALHHIEKHFVTPDEAEQVVEAATPPYPERLGSDKRRSVRRTRSGRFLQVIFLLRDPETVDPSELTMEQLETLQQAMN